MLPAEVLDLLRQWWKARPTAYDAGLAPEQRWLFPGRSKPRPLTTRQFGRLFKQAAKAAGLRKTLSLHTLRHSFARSSRFQKTQGSSKVFKYAPGSVIPPLPRR